MTNSAKRPTSGSRLAGDKRDACPAPEPVQVASPGVGQPSRLSLLSAPQQREQFARCPERADAALGHRILHRGETPVHRGVPAHFTLEPQIVQAAWPTVLPMLERPCGTLLRACEPHGTSKRCRDPRRARDPLPETDSSEILDQHDLHFFGFRTQVDDPASVWRGRQPRGRP